MQPPSDPGLEVPLNTRNQSNPLSAGGTKPPYNSMKLAGEIPTIKPASQSIFNQQRNSRSTSKSRGNVNKTPVSNDLPLSPLN